MTCANAALAGADESDLLEDEAGADEGAGRHRQRKPHRVVRHPHPGFLLLLLLSLSRGDAANPRPIPSSRASPPKFEGAQREARQFSLSVCVNVFVLIRARARGGRELPAATTSRRRRRRRRKGRRERERAGVGPAR